MMLWWAGLALAQPQLNLSAGLEAGANDPFVRRWGGCLGAEARPWPFLGADLRSCAYPDLGVVDHTALTRDLLDRNQLSPNISKIMSRNRLAVHWPVVRVARDGMAASAGVLAGAGLVRTRDAVPASDNRGQHAREFHPTFAWGLAAEARQGPLGLRVRFGQSRYVEHVAGEQDWRVPVWFGTDLVWWPSTAGSSG